MLKSHNLIMVQFKTSVKFGVSYDMKSENLVRYH